MVAPCLTLFVVTLYVSSHQGRYFLSLSIDVQLEFLGLAHGFVSIVC